MHSQPPSEMEIRQMLDLGRQARVADYGTRSCNLQTFDPRRAYWLAGWHDADIELKQSKLGA